MPNNPYIAYLSSLHTVKIVNKQAPHKADLLLSIMDLVEVGIIIGLHADADGEALVLTFITILGMMLHTAA